jgi:cell division protein ZapA
MSETKDASVEILGRIYQIKCPAAEETSLHRAAQYLEEKMRHTRETGALSMDRIAIVTALNVVHQLLTLEQQKNHHFQLINQRLHQLQNKVEQALAYHEQLEFQSAE